MTTNIKRILSMVMYSSLPLKYAPV